MANVVDQLGDSIAARCWWDTEPWAATRQALAAAAGQPSAVPPSFHVSMWHPLPRHAMQFPASRHHKPVGSWSLHRGVATQACSQGCHPPAVQRVMAQVASIEDNVRWVRVLAELAHSAAALCPASCRRACEYIASRLQVWVDTAAWSNRTSSNMQAVGVLPIE
jgi:hypothetical protein